MDMPGVAVDGDRLVHGSLGADRRGVGRHGSGLLTTMVDEVGVGEASHARRRGLVSMSQGSGPLAAVVDEGGVAEVGRTH